MWTLRSLIGTLPPLAKALVRGCLDDWPVPADLGDQGRMGAPKQGYRRARRLTVEEVDALVAGYEAGRTVYQLGREFGVHRVTASQHLARRGVTMRMQGLSISDLVEVRELRAQGWSYERIGRSFGVWGCTVRRFLAKHAG